MIKVEKILGDFYHTLDNCSFLFIYTFGKTVTGDGIVASFKECHQTVAAMNVTSSPDHKNGSKYSSHLYMLQPVTKTNNGQIGSITGEITRKSPLNHVGFLSKGIW